MTNEENKLNDQRTLRTAVQNLSELMDNNTKFNLALELLSSVSGREQNMKLHVAVQELKDLRENN